jgi:hypothetical protein
MPLGIDSARGNGMPLTRAERKLVKIAKEIAELTGNDLNTVGDWEDGFRPYGIRASINHMVIGEIITRYTLLDELLASLISKYFFRVPKQRTNFKKWWRTKKFKIFNHFIMDETFLLKKLQIANAIRPLPGNIQSSIHRINSVRNAFAHSFFPENRKEHKKLGKVLYMGKDIRTPEGLDAFITDARKTYNFIAKRVFPGWVDEDSEPELPEDFVVEKRIKD